MLDNTAVHPESYDACELLLKKLGYTHEDIRNHDLDLIDLKIKEIGLKNLAEELNIGEPPLRTL